MTVYHVVGTVVLSELHPGMLVRTLGGYREGLQPDYCVQEVSPESVRMTDGTKFYSEEEFMFDILEEGTG